MNLIDLALVVIILLSGMLGLYWGIIRQVISLVGVIAGIVLAGRYGGEVAIALSSFITDTSLAALAGFIIVLVVVTGIAGGIATLLHRFAGLLFLGWLDHLAGGIIGLLQGAFAGTALVLFATFFPHPSWSTMLAESQVAPFITSTVGQLVAPLLPEIFRIIPQ